LTQNVTKLDTECGKILPKAVLAVYASGLDHRRYPDPNAFFVDATLL
jgi:hypothetical protein